MVILNVLALIKESSFLVYLSWMMIFVVLLRNQIDKSSLNNLIEYPVFVNHLKQKGLIKCIAI